VVKKLLDAAFLHGEDRFSRGFAFIWLGSLFVLGAVLWRYFLNGGVIQLNLHDWLEAAKRYAFLQDAVMGGGLPLHTPGTSTLRAVTDRFITVVDTNLSPQILLLGFLQIGPFMLANTLLLYSAGFYGMLRLRRRFRLSPVAFSFMFFLLIFNGHITAHIAVGHVHWAAYFLVPFFALLVFDVAEGKTGWRWTFSYSLLLFIVFLQGAFHLFVLFLLFTGLLALSYPSQIRSILRAMAFAILLSMARILPPVLEAGNFDTEFLSGYTSTFDLLAAFVTLRPAIRDQVFGLSPLNPLNWWELDIYLGLLGLTFALFYGFFKVQRNESLPQYKGLLWPILIISVMSLGRVYKLVHLLSIPLLDSQRVSSRLLFLPIAMMIILAAISFQRATADSRRDVWTRVALLGLLGLMAQDLWQHFKLWRVVNMGNLFPPTPLDLDRYFVANHPDPPYVALLIVGLIVSAATFIFLLYKSSTEQAPTGPT
jgi:hypothetical protein